MIKVVYHNENAASIEYLIRWLNEKGLPHERIVSIASDGKIWTLIWYEVVEVRDPSDEIDFEINC